MSWLIYVSAMNGQKNTAFGPNTGGRNKNKTAKKNVNRCSTLTLALGNTVPAEDVPGPSETSTATDTGMETVQASTALPEPTKCKKRSVVGGTEAEEGVAPKKAKTDDTPAAKKHESRIFRNSRLKKHKKNRVFKDQADDEEEMESTPATSATEPAPAPQASKKLKRKADKAKTKVGDQNNSMQNTDDVNISDKKTDEFNNQTKKPRKRKHQKKPTKMETEDEPNVKMQKKSLDSLASLDKEITDVLEKMNEEHNQVTDMIDNMVPSAPVPYGPLNENIARRNGTHDCNEFDLNEVVQWTQNHWNKDSAEATVHYISIHFVVVENLPFVMMPVYKHKLTDLFEKYGTVTHIGPPELKSCGEHGPMFNTTVWFDTEMAAVKALNEDNTRFGDVIIRVRRSLPTHPLHPDHCPTHLPTRMRSTTLRLRRSNKFGKNTALGAVH